MMATPAAGAGSSAPATSFHESATEMSDIASRDEDLPFIGTDETFSTRELMVHNNTLFLERIGLAEIGPRRIGAMDEAGINVQVLSAHTPGVQDIPGQEGIDFAYRLNKMLVDGRWPPIRGGSRRLQPCRCRVRKPQRTNWNAPFGKMASLGA